MATARKSGMAVGTTVARINVKVSPDTDQFRVELQAELDAIERTMKGRVEIKADLDSAQARADFRRLVSQMQKQGKVRVGVDMVPGTKGGSSGGGAGGGGGGGKNKLNRNMFGIPKGSIPRFGSGINPAGYVAILGAAVLVAAPLVGLLTTAILAIPGLISAIATPFMAITLGLEGIKKAASGSGLFKLDEEGKIEGLGEVFDPIKKAVSEAFDTGLSPAFKALAQAVQPLLGSLPKVATGLSDMFKGFTDSLTSKEGVALFDQTIQNIGKAMSDAAPGIRDFTMGMMGLATSFTAQLPAFSGWLNKTGDSFAKWVTEMTTIPDPAGHHGPDPNGKAPMTTAFEGLGDTLRTIGDWVVDMGNVGLKFVSDPNKMKDFVATLDNIGTIITKLTDLGNQMAAVWRNLGMLPALNSDVAEAEANKIINPPADAPKPGANNNWFENLIDNTVGKLFDGSKGPGMRDGSLSGVQADIADISKQLDELSGNVTERLKTSSLNPAEDPVLSNYKGRMNNLREQLEALKAEEAALMPQVGLKSFETPLVGGEGATGTFVDPIIAGLAKVPPAAQTAKEALQAVQDTGVLTPAALGALSDNANGGPVTPIPTPAPVAPPVPVTPPPVEAPVVEAPEPVDVPAPDLGAFKAAFDELPGVVTTAGAAVVAAAQGVAESVKGPFLNLGMEMVPVGQNISGGLAAGITAGKSRVISAAIEVAVAAITAAKGKLEISSPSKVFEAIGGFASEGLGIGMENGIGPVIDQAKGLASKVSDAFASGLDPTTALEGYGKKQIDAIEGVLSYQQNSIGLQIRKLERAAKKAGKSPQADALKAEADALREQQEELSIQDSEIGLAQQFQELKNPKKEKSGNVFLDAINELMSLPKGFASATADQAQQDLGISGDGALQSLAGFGMDFVGKGITNVFNTSNVEDTLSAHFGVTNRQAQGMVSR